MKTTTNSFLQGIDGNWSSTRLIGFIVVVAALALSEQILLFRGAESIIVTAAAAGTMFLTVQLPFLERANLRIGPTGAV